MIGIFYQPLLFLQKLRQDKDGLSVHASLHMGGIIRRKPDSANARAAFHNHGRTFHFQVLDHGYIVAVEKLVAVAVGNFI